MFIYIRVCTSYSVNDLVSHRARTLFPLNAFKDRVWKRTPGVFSWGLRARRCHTVSLRFWANSATLNRLAWRKWIGHAALSWAAKNWAEAQSSSVVCSEGEVMLDKETLKIKNEYLFYFITHLFVSCLQRLCDFPKMSADLLKVGHTALIFSAPVQGTDQQPRVCDFLRRFHTEFVNYSACLIWEKRTDDDRFRPKG